MRIAGLFVAVTVAAGLLGIAVSALYSMEIKRAVAVGAIFMVVHLGTSFGLQMMR